MHTGLITLIDDDQEHLLELTTLLHNEGYTSNSFMEFGNALQSIFENKPDLILLDMKLGNKKGFALNQEIL